MHEQYIERREKLYDWMHEENIDLVLIDDNELARDPALRWLTGHNADALVFLIGDRRCVLVPWDVHLAAQNADADAIVAYNEFERDPLQALLGVAMQIRLPPGSRIEIPPGTPYPRFLKYTEILSDWDIICREDGAHEYIRELRAIKDEGEIAIYRELSEFTNEIIDLVAEEFGRKDSLSEIDIALLIEAEARRRGCEGTSFETLAAGPSRSFAIHAFPTYTDAPIGTEGLSILDFGLRYKGYSSDVTLTIARSLKTRQRRLLSLVQKAHDMAIGYVRAGLKVRDLASYIESFFTKSDVYMPHSLGHGIGLETHEAPFIRNRDDNKWVFQEGMIFTIEPGLYYPKLGGCRLEDDILLGPDGPEVLTRSRIIEL